MDSSVHTEKPKTIKVWVNFYLWAYPNVKKKWAYEHSAANPKNPTQNPS